MSSYEVEEREGLIRDLRCALSFENFEAVKDAPSEWLREMFPEVVAYGGSVYHVKYVIDAWKVKYYNLEKVSPSSFYQRRTREILRPIKERLNGFRGETMYRPAVELIQLNGLAAKDSPKEFNMMLLRFIEAVEALQMRHRIAMTSRFGMNDYNILTEELLHGFGMIHRDDDPVLGMTEYPTFHAVPIFDGMAVG